MECALSVRSANTNTLVMPPTDLTSLPRRLQLYAYIPGCCKSGWHLNVLLHRMIDRLLKKCPFWSWLRRKRTRNPAISQCQYSLQEHRTSNASSWPNRVLNVSPHFLFIPATGVPRSCSSVHPSLTGATVEILRSTTFGLHHCLNGHPVRCTVHHFLSEGFSQSRSLRSHQKNNMERTKTATRWKFPLLPRYKKENRGEKMTYFSGDMA